VSFYCRDQSRPSKATTGARARDHQLTRRRLFRLDTAAAAAPSPKQKTKTQQPTTERMLQQQQQQQQQADRPAVRPQIQPVARSSGEKLRFLLPCGPPLP
jgi:hypothetical protein